MSVRTLTCRKLTTSSDNTKMCVSYHLRLIHTESQFIKDIRLKAINMNEQTTNKLEFDCTQTFCFDITAVCCGRQNSLRLRGTRKSPKHLPMMSSRVCNRNVLVSRALSSESREANEISRELSSGWDQVRMSSALLYNLYERAFSTELFSGSVSTPNYTSLHLDYFSCVCSKFTQRTALITNRI